MDSSASDSVHHRTILGCSLYSTIIAVFLYGITSIQTVYYFEHFPNDRNKSKALVAGLWLLVTATIVLNGHSLHMYFIIHYGDFDAVDPNLWSASLEGTLTSINISIVQLFFITSIWKMHRDLHPPSRWMYLALVSFIIIVLLFLAGIPVASILTSKSSQTKTVSHYAKTLTTLSIVGVTALDCFITFGLLYVMNQPQKAISSTRTGQVMRKLMLFLLTRGIVMLVVQAALMIEYLIWQHLLVGVFFHSIMSNIYASSLLVTLNNRHRIQEANERTA